MIANRFLAIALVGCSVLNVRLANSRADQWETFRFHHENVLGTSLELKVATADPRVAALAETAALTEIDRLAKILSAWDPSSEFSRWTRTRGEAIVVSQELTEVLGLYDKWRASTAGAINAAAATANSLWRDAAKQGREPSPAQLRAAADRIQSPHWRIDARAGTATHLDEAPLALASFTKSYVAGKAADAAMSATDRVNGIVLNIGGDIVVRGALAEPVDIRDPRADTENDAPLGRVLVGDGAIATSGDYRRGVDITGKHYSHIIDPHTARPSGDVISSTVQAKDAATAGALATAFSVLAPEESARIAAGYKDVNYLIVRRDGSLMASNEWAKTMAFAPAQAAPSSAFELIVNLGLARVNDPRYRRPYVAVWIEDQDKFPIRTLALWLEKPRWLPDLKAWYRGDRLRALSEGTEITASVSSATRPPGRYTLRWDGRDSAGKPVKQGKYTLFIEAAREHGTYQLMRQEMDFTGSPKQVQLPGNTEIEFASLDYRKATR